MSGRGQGAGSSLVALFAAVFLFMFADTVLQTIVPVTLKETGAASASLIGVLVALPQGVGFITALPASAYGDTCGSARMASRAACVATLGSLVAVAAVGRPAAWWLLPVIGLGLTRLVVWTSVLAAVSTSGDPHVIQGWNGATQRGAAAVAAVATAVVVGRQAWSSAYLGIAVSYALLIPLLLIVLHRVGEGQDLLPRPAESYRFATEAVVRDPAIRASSLVALCATLAVPAQAWPVTAVAGVLQGAAICLCIGCTNLLAVGSRGGRVAGPGLRIASSNLGACVGSLFLTIGMGAVLQHGGRTLLFASAAAVTALLGACARWSIRSHSLDRPPVLQPVPWPAAGNGPTDARMSDPVRSKE